MSYYHGIEVKEVDSGGRPIQVADNTIIAVVGTAPDADVEKFPLNTPTIIYGSKIEAAHLGNSGTLPDALDGILEQIGAYVVVVRVEQKEDENEQLAEIVGNIVNETGTGLQALLDAKTKTGIKPNLLICPHFSANQAVATELQTIAEKLKAIAIIDVIEKTVSDAIKFKKNFGSDRLYLIYPQVKILDKNGNEKIVAASSYAAGLTAKVHQEVGFHASPSNHIINGILGTDKPIDYESSNYVSRANLLNENNISTIINWYGGYRLWGNKTSSLDTKFFFMCVRKTADVLNETIQNSMQYAVDRGITKTLVDTVVSDVNKVLRRLKSEEKIAGGECFKNPEINTNDQIALGHLKIEFDYGPIYPAERITFYSILNNDYSSEIFT